MRRQIGFLAGPAVQAELMRTVAALTIFALAARSLGPANYGVLVACSFAVSILFPLASAGWLQLVVKKLARGSLTAAQALPSTAAVGAVASLITVVTLVPTGNLWLPQSGAGTVAILVLTESLYSVQGFMAACAQGRSDFTRYRNSLTAATGSRLTAVCLFVAVTGGDLFEYALLSLGGSVLALLLTALTLRSYGWSRSRLDWRANLRQGRSFGVILSSSRVLDDLDKYLLVALSAPTEAGLYASAYRVASYSLVGARGFMVTQLPVFMKAGGEQLLPANYRRLTLRSLKGSIALFLPVALAAAAAAPAFGALLGPEFAGVTILIWATLPCFALRAVHFCLGDALVGLGQEGSRLRLTLLSAASSVPIYGLLISFLGVSGAVIGSYIVEALLVLLFGLSLRHALRST